MIRVIADIQEDGSIVLSVEGATGDACYKATESIRNKGKILSDTKTEAYYELGEAENRSYNLTRR